MIVAGLTLENLPPDDMIDVIHYLFEEDTTSVSSAEQAEARDSVRKTVYEQLYDVEYKYGSKRTSSGLENLDPALDDELPVPVDPLAKSFSTKPYVPSTSFDPDSPLPFGNVLDAPLR